MTDTQALIERKALIDEIIGMYHTTRLSDTPAADHILSKPSVQKAFAAYEAIALTEAEAKLAKARGKLDILQMREAAYRSAHDLHGDGSMKAGAAWDAMRRAGDDARACLAELGGYDG